MYKLENIRAIVGLGNPGGKYSNTRHNIGFRIVEGLSDKFMASWSSNDLMESTDIQVGENFQRIILIKPLTFMNTSGKVFPYLNKKGIKPEEVLVVHDELEKKFGYIGIRFGGSAKGHNGLRSIIGMVGTDFWRLRFGIGRPDDKSEVGNYVLSNFTSSEESEIPTLIEKAIDEILQQGF